MSTKIFAMTHKAFTPPQDSLYQPLHVGHANASDLGFLGDDVGEHISDKNCFYAELSGVYWVYKNFHETDYVGICHYRRYLINAANRLFTESEIEQILSRYDLMVTKTLELRSNYYEGFAQNHNLSDLKIIEKILEKKYPKDYQIYKKLVHENKTYFGNICIMSKQLFDQYCSWLFDIFFEAEKHILLTNYDQYQMRFYGFVSEFLLYVYVKSRGLKPYECKVGMIGEKIETKECKERLATYFSSKDFAGAKAYFLDCQKKRPDLLMEASDVTGELRQCMQVIATANLEYESYGHTLLDNNHDYHQLMELIANLNAAMNRFALGKQTQNDETFLKNSNISSIALEVSARMYCKDETQRQQILEQLNKGN